jgi:RimJ/RimL family protein N-acetyltransferase
MSGCRLTLVDVYSSPSALDVLYQLLEERKPEINISHRELPTWSDHCAFVASHPYEAWYLLKADADIVGAIYLSRADEIGLFVFQAHQGRGYGRRALELLMERHPRERYLVNINPANEHSIAFVSKFGFRHIQNTYEKR